MHAALVLPAPMDPQAHFFYASGSAANAAPMHESTIRQAPVAPACVRMYVAGGSKGWPGPGGWAALLVTEKNGKVFEKLVSGHHHRTNTYQMTIMAILAGADLLKRPVSVEVCSVQKWLSEHFTREALIRHLPDEYSPSDIDHLLARHTVSAKWSPKEKGDPMIERVRGIAQREASLALRVA